MGIRLQLRLQLGVVVSAEMWKKESSTAVDRLKREVERARRKKGIDGSIEEKGGKLLTPAEAKTKAILNNAMMSNAEVKPAGFATWGDDDLFAMRPETQAGSLEILFPDLRQPQALQKERNKLIIEYKADRDGN